MEEEGERREERWERVESNKEQGYFLLISLSICS
jgi:hypothetical protein